MMRRLLILLEYTTILLALASGKRSLGRMEIKVTHLTDDVGELKKLVENLIKTVETSCLCKTIKDTNSSLVNETVIVVDNSTDITANKTETEEKVSPAPKESKNTKPFVIEEIKRTGLGLGKVSYSVTYLVDPKASISHSISFWNRRSKDNFDEKIPGSKIEISPSVFRGLVYTASVVTESESQTSVHFVFGAAHVWYALTLDNSNDANMTLTNISLPELFVKQKKIVYSPGENASFQIVVSEDIDFDKDFSMSELILTKVGTHNFVSLFSGDGYSIEPPKFSDINMTDEKYLSITLDTSKLPISGVFTFKATSCDYDDAFLLKIDVYRRSTIYPSHLSRPFDKDLFAFYKTYWRKDNDGNLSKNCEISAFCILSCPLIVGSNKTEMAIWHWKNNIDQGIKVQITPKKIVENPFYITGIEGKIPKGVTEVFCEATRLNPFKTITEGIRINWVTRAKVTSGRVKVKGEGFHKTIRVICSARGIPVPEMTIRVECAAGILAFSRKQLDTLAQSENFIRVSKDVILTREFFYQNVNASCIAENEAGQDTMELRPVYIF